MVSRTSSVPVVSACPDVRPSSGANASADDVDALQENSLAVLQIVAVVEVLTLTAGS